MAEILFGEIEENFWIANDPDFESLLGRKVLESAEEIEKNGTLDIIVNRPGRLEVEVVEPGELLPFMVKLVRREEGWFWDCDCTCSWPCNHLGSILLRIRNNDKLKIFARQEIEPEERLDDSGELFQKVDEARQRLGSAKDDVQEFPLAPEEQKYLDLEDVINNKKKPASLPGMLVFTMLKGSDGVNRIAPGALKVSSSGKPGKLDDIFAIERISSDISAEEELLLEKVRASYSKEIPVLPEIFLFVNERAHLYLPAEKKFYNFREYGRLKAGFRFSGILKNNDLEFFPVFVPEVVNESDLHARDLIGYTDEEGGSDKGAAKNRIGLKSSANEYRLDEIHISGNRIFCLDAGKVEIGYLNSDPDTRFILSMMKQSSRKVSSAEINRIKALASERNPGNIQFDFSLEKAEVISRAPDTILNMSHGREECRISFWFRYGVQEIHHSSSVQHLNGGLDENGKVLFLQKRNPEFEGLVMDAIRAGFKKHLAAERGPYNRFLSNDEHDLTIMLDINQFFDLHAPFLMEKEIEIRINGRKIVKSSSISFNVKMNNDWFDIKLDFPDEEGEVYIDDELLQHNVIQKGGKYIILTTEDIQELVKLQKMGMDAHGYLKTSSDNLGVIDIIYEQTIEKENLLKQKKEIIDHLKNFSDHREVVPLGLNATLREYQEEGFQRLTFWHKYHLNGCLADDMGLGKTVQTLAHLQKLKEDDNLSVSLLIAPVVTIPNWEAEAARFTPDIKTFRHAGTGKLKSWRKGKSFDLIIVSYNTLRNDVEFFSEVEFDYIILDEAHYVKNAASQTFKSIRGLKSRHRLSLTGTPLENNTLELWTQMNFLNPWLLGSLKEFRNVYARPIEKMGDQGAMDTLRAVISPFFLRRKKDEVLDDLPPKEEILVYSEMGVEQEAAYNKMKAALRQRVLDLLENNEGRKSAVEILTFMLKLRQMAILPVLADKKYSDLPSCKMDSLFLLLEEVLSENHKVLIFSQFTSVIDYLEAYCKKKRLKHVTLTGSTRDRAVPVKKFQEDENVRIFLLSLKAGGVGINLTAADYVILFDPWWNPAAEAQAVDRAHRMGQKRKVFTYRIIARNTIEEKIMALQQRKKELADNLISDSGGAFSSMDKDDILNLFQ
ncbi:MAG: DEAD/DEAH box helicase [Spirochaetales bacterium]|nr:DEAD/DEAH box helicase [Spirochaetales bacterium]